jgi:hypothetical protein
MNEVSKKQLDALLNILEDIELMQIIKERAGEEEISVDIDDL